MLGRPAENLPPSVRQISKTLRLRKNNMKQRGRETFMKIGQTSSDHPGLRYSGIYSLSNLLYMLLIKISYFILIKIYTGHQQLVFIRLAFLVWQNMNFGSFGVDSSMFPA
jgi:hypothetical protein